MVGGLGGGFGCRLTLGKARFEVVKKIGLGGLGVVKDMCGCRVWLQPTATNRVLANSLRPPPAHNTKLIKKALLFIPFVFGLPYLEWRRMEKETRRKVGVMVGKGANPAPSRAGGKYTFLFKC